MLLTFHVSNLISLFTLLRPYQSINPGPRQVFKFRNRASFYGEELATLRQSLKLVHHALSAVRDCLFNIFGATLHIGGLSSIRNLRSRHAVVTGIQSPVYINNSSHTQHITLQLYITRRLVSALMWAIIRPLYKNTKLYTENMYLVK